MLEYDASEGRACSPLRARHTPEPAFAAAQRSFEAGDYAAAQAHCDAVKALLPAHCTVRAEGRFDGAVTSIIILSHRHSAEVAELVRALRDYQEDPFELIFVDNGNRQLEDMVARTLHRFKLISPGFNFGCSGGRNLGAEHARGRYVLFVDDDGAMARGAIETLIETIESERAVVVRGRILVKTEDSYQPSHYDMGDAMRPCVPNAEGWSIWRRDAFIRFGGFDPLLRGHEGALLAARMRRDFGPEAFLYTPHAVLRHDFSSSPDALEGKLAEHAGNCDYLTFCEPDWRGALRDINKAAKGSSRSRQLRDLFRRFELRPRRRAQA